MREIRFRAWDKKRQAELAIRFHQEKDDLSLPQKQAMYVTISAMKRGGIQVLGNIYENPELLTKTT